MKSTNEPTDIPLIIQTNRTPEPAQSIPEWKPTETKGIEQNSKGELRTNTPNPFFHGYLDGFPFNAFSGEI